MKKEAVVIYGPPASGKSTEARKYTSKGYRELNRDAYREILADDKNNIWGSPAVEGLVSGLWMTDYRKYVRQGKNLVISDTLSIKWQREAVFELLRSDGYDIVSFLLLPPFEELVRRDSLRGNRAVGQQVILTHWDRFKGEEV